MAAAGKIRGAVGKKSDSSNSKNKKYIKVRDRNKSRNKDSKDRFIISKDKIVKRLEKDLLLKLS
jgi:hypothetical protein